MFDFLALNLHDHKKSYHTSKGVYVLIQSTPDVSFIREPE